MFKTVTAVAFLAAFASAASAQGVDYFRQQGQMTCMTDVLALCAAYVPYEAQIISCMRQRRAQLSAPCRQVFDAGVSAQRRAHSQ